MFMTQTQKRNWTQELSKFASRPANLRPNAEEILDAEVIKTRVQTCKSASSGTERKDQIRVLQTKTASRSFTVRKSPSEGPEVQSSLALGHQTRASVINSKTASETASENQTGSYSVLRVFLGFSKTSSNGEA